MTFGVREICEVTLRAKSTMTLGNRKFYKDEPVLYFDTLKTSSLEGAATSVYATGGRGNNRLVAWEGERTLTFTMEDALISPESFSILSGAGLIAATKEKPIYQHVTGNYPVDADNTIVLPVASCWNKYDKNDEYYNDYADIFIMTKDEDGNIDAEPCIPFKVGPDHKTITCYGHSGLIPSGSIVFVDYYVKRTGNAQMIEITPDKFGGSFYLEASTLFRRQGDNYDMPAEFIIPNCKIQSNFTFSMAATGDPSTFTFTIDAFPDYTKFDKTHKVLAAIEVITDETGEEEGKREPCNVIKAYDYETGVISYGNKKVSDLYEDDVDLTLKGDNNYSYLVTGTFKPIDEWAELPHSIWQPVVTDNSAFYAIQIPAEYKRHKLEVFSNGDSKTSTNSMGDQELFWVLNVTNKPTIRFDIDGEPMIELDFSGITIAEDQ